MSTDRAFGIFPGDNTADPPDAIPSGNTPTEAVTEAKQVRPPRISATRPLPPARFPVAKQLEILRSHVVASKNGTVRISNAELARVAGMHVNNVSIVNPFFSSVGLIARSDNGFLPSAVAQEYNHAAAWTPETAGEKLAPAFRDSWFGQLVSQQLSLRPRSEKEVINALADAVRAPADAGPSLQMLIEYLVIAGLVAVVDGVVHPVRQQAGDVERAAGTGGQPPAPPAPPPQPLATSTREKRTESGSGSDQGQGIRFAIDINVTMQEMAAWSPDRITAFFAGLAQIISAKGGGREVLKVRDTRGGRGRCFAEHRPCRPAR